MFDIYLGMLKEEEQFDNSKIPYKYSIVIGETLRNDLIVQAGRVESLPPASPIQLISIRALQRARNKDVADDYKERQEEMNRNK